jgi:hypothetical protein
MMGVNHQSTDKDDKQRFWKGKRRIYLRPVVKDFPRPCYYRYCPGCSRGLSIG